jgi:hypothetical protein
MAWDSVWLGWAWAVLVLAWYFLSGHDLDMGME